MAMELPRGPGEGSNDTTYKQNRFKAETWSIKKFGLPHRALFNCRKCSRGTSPKCMTDTKVQPHAGTMQRIWTRRVNTMRISRAKARSRILQTTEMATRSTQMGHHLPPQPEHNVIRTPPASNLSLRPDLEAALIKKRPTPSGITKTSESDLLPAITRCPQTQKLGWQSEGWGKHRRCTQPRRTSEVYARSRNLGTPNSTNRYGHRMPPKPRHNVTRTHQNLAHINTSKRNDRI